MTGNIQYDARKIFRHACAFADCASFCEKEPNSIIVRTQWYTIPDIANSAFACEVFIKSLLIWNGMSIEEVKKYGHGLKRLWDALLLVDEEIANHVKLSVLCIYSHPSDAFFEKAISDISNAFYEWRYIYEGNGEKVNLQFLRLFRDALREVCCKELYNISWTEYSKGNEYGKNR